MGGTVVNGEMSDEEKCLCLFGNSISGNIFHGFLQYRPLTGNDGTVQGSIMPLARLDAWVKTALACLEKN